MVDVEPVDMKIIPKNSYLRALALGAIISACVNSAFFLAEWWAVFPHGSVAGLRLVFILLLPILGAIITVPVALVVAILKRTRRRALQTALFALIYAIIPIVSIRWADDIRMHAFSKLAERSAPLVKAIGQFETDYGYPPGELADLVPDYLPTVPSTGMGAYPKYEYQPKSTNDTFCWAPWPEGNSWVLYVNTPSGVINWDMFIYFPNGKYPKHAYSSWLERIGNWAYCHE